ncbi:type VI secretion system protein ImpG [Andreprevotia lacus DSM 23236]|jgi:type VI secretion system protein ImpG|uniref:Type VI secretion system protein ImpG n=1 Tax=Andreprevotia lacus DSM 23236 TaxID=1121001 RepID=A0A1W1XFU9_9NEIS|nr:type VI secretion system baseplate subunit TssF [Andreprevotia lacus]SMC22853.1 type VI secretion system protein ImpG [Andreprevotia lacus DSM 23236]
MQNELLPYYNRELASLRQLGREFASQFPKVAGRLLLEEGVSEDPHVERLIESFAFLTARIHHKLDDEFPEITDALLGVLYPHYLRPIPSMSVAQFTIDPTKMNLSSKLAIPRHSQLLSRRVNDMPCRFRTAYPVELWPVTVADARFEPIQRADFALRREDAAAIVRIRIQAHPGQFLNDMGIDKLRFFLQGESPVMHALYELLFNNVHKTTIYAGGNEVRLPADAIRPVGFEEDEGLLDYDKRSSIAYRLLQEYFVFPDKFMFFDVVGLAAAPLPPACRDMEIAIYISEFERAERLAKLADTINADTFRLGCAPIVNLFRQSAEPLQITHLKTEYQVIPDIRRPWGMEVYSVNSVRKLVQGEGRAEIVEYQPFFGLHHANEADAQQTFWLATRRPGARADDPGSDVYLSLVDLDFDPNLPATEALSIEISCTNRELPGLLPFGGEQGDFEIEGGSPVSRIHCLRKPTATQRPAMGRSAMWRLISHLSLNQLSIADGESESTEAFRELLGLYNFANSAATRKQIMGIRKVSSKPTMAKIASGHQAAFVRGIAVELELDEEQFEGAGVYLLSCVLERFLGLYGSINSFTRLTVKTQQREKPMRTWPPRAGKAVLA